MRRAMHQMRRAIAEESKRFPSHLVRLPDAEVADRFAHLVAQGMTPPVEVWRSRDYLVQVFAATTPAVERLTMQRIETTPEGWIDGISWDVLQKLKAECGRGEQFAVEIFPADRDLVNVANLRHLWMLNEPPAFAWRADQ